MNINTPFKDAFKLAKNISIFSNWVLIISTLLALIATFFAGNFPPTWNTKEVLDTINVVLIFLYITSDIFVHTLLPKAETKRRLTYLDNSFDTNFCGEKSENYYDNEKLKPGLLKLTANCFESAFFTYKISRRMLLPLVIKNVLIIVAFLYAAYSGQKSFLILLSQLTLPIVLLQQLVKLFVFVSSNERVLDNFRELFSDIKGKGYDEKIPQIIRNILYYESNISWASVILSGKIYKRLNNELTEKWEEMKKLYEIG